MIVDSETGEVYSQDVSPKYQEWKYDDYRKLFKKNKLVRYLNPMRAQELMGDKLDAILEDELTFAEKKWDGHRGLTYMGMLSNRVFSRNISEESGWFSENSDQMPHIRDTAIPDLKGTVLDGEVILPVKNCTSRDVQGVTGALPGKALQTQVERGFAEIDCYDILYYKGLNVQHFPLWKRKLYLWKAICEINAPFFKFCNLYCKEGVMNELKKRWKDYNFLSEDELKGINKYLVKVEDYNELFQEMLDKGDEGIILKNIDGQYRQKRSSDFTKMKGHNTYDCVIMGYEDPTMEYTGKTELDKWTYWYHPESDSCWEGVNDFSDPDSAGSVPVTKLFCKGWIGAIHFGVWKSFDKDSITEEQKQILDIVRNKYGEFAVMEDKYTYSYLEWVGRCAGLNDETRDEISKHKENYLGAVIEVEAQKIINYNTGSLQHPRFIQFRPDKNSEECTFDAHIRKYKEDK